MKKIRRNVSLNQRLAGISLAVFIPMILVMTYLLASLTNATSAYAQITKSVSYANMYARDFKERMDYSMYLAVIGKRNMEELGDGETTVNGILTVNPYKYIDELEETCDKLSFMATVDSNRNQIKRLKNSLKSLKGCVKELDTSIEAGGAYEDKMNYLNENIYMLTSLIQEGIQDYICGDDQLYECKSRTGCKKYKNICYMYLDIRSGDSISPVFDNEGGKKCDKANTEIMPDDTTGGRRRFYSTDERIEYR